MVKASFDPTTRIVNSEVKQTCMLREYSTLHDVKIDDGCSIYERVSIKKSTIGKNVSINAGTYIENSIIGDDVMIGPNCTIVGVTHTFTPEIISKEDTWKRITIGKGAFLGGSVVVLPGRSIGEGSVIGAGTIINKDIPAHSIVMGIAPNQRIKKIIDYQRE